jgi:hypothetical protein
VVSTFWVVWNNGKNGTDYLRQAKIVIITLQFLQQNRHVTVRKPLLIGENIGQLSTTSTIFVDMLLSGVP